MAHPIETIQHLGPYGVSDITDAMLQDLVCRQQMPVIIKQALPQGGVSYAVLATKEVRLVCAGCFKRDMSITDTSRCKKCASFVKHFYTFNGKDGSGRRTQCKEDGDIQTLDANCTRVVVADAGTDDAGTDDAAGALVRLQDISDDDLQEELSRRHLSNDHALALVMKDPDLVESVLENADPDVFAKVLTHKDVFPILGARPSRLIHELFRQASGTDMDTYYMDYTDEHPEPEGSDLPHKSKPVVGSVTGKVVGIGTRKRKKTNPLTCYTWHTAHQTDYRAKLSATIVDDEADSQSTQGTMSKPSSPTK